MSCYAVVGMGSIAKRHISNLRCLHPESQIFVVSSSGSGVDLPLGADAIVEIEYLLDVRPEYVIVASPSPFHVVSAEKLLARKIRVLVEKPVSDNYLNALKFSRFCDDFSPEMVAVGYCLRFLPSSRVVRDFIQNHNLGAIYQVSSNVGQYLPDWRSDKNFSQSVSARKELGGGVLLELSHEIDFLLWILGDLKLRHSWLRVSQELGLNVEDTADLVLTADDGLYVSLHLDFIQKSVQRRCEFIGEKGRLVWDLIENSVTLYEAKGATTLYSDPNYVKNTMYLDMLLAFENAQDNNSHLASVKSSLRVMEIIDEAKALNSWRENI